MTEVTMSGLVLAKNVFQAHGMRPDGSVAFRVKLARIKVLAFFEGSANLHGGDGSLRQRPLLGS